MAVELTLAIIGIIFLGLMPFILAITGTGIYIGKEKNKRQDIYVKSKQDKDN